ncbi:U5 snRNP complex ATPase subunit Brr2 [Schizosaccharomyces pombe]|uniref:Pre-mRNA-splicing factor brr2 n=1 Tax=Schizosaccharomyces pombe (strain 972 / ATCC 24843) TaxID=284812 RepID=BRR2_SCHPO|nr:putative U5 snRNP complex subunit Brr2 [Schizosaccharomyces pombe]Q9UT24.1 RecName: Full=Pre-mRNA-splicing factor brr2; AltName: Full=Pre-mRNA-splicing factor spp41; AltName: Full=Pre-mRNA-splicing helicase BRR2 [Schizosaccharomyces pombe 972h-]CAB57421.1 U5 snRNP complex subunit Brr2 (predicted) [Schizosaccharomyces pombe]|eukprot:NP_593346.1 putative U5 snRNP complex subunit Brr2 [Schizosaccharomyces pombe]
MSSAHPKGDSKEPPKHGNSKEKPNYGQSQYSYSAMSNLVTQADRRFVSRRDAEPTGEPESLVNRVSIADMGSRARIEKPSTLPLELTQEVQEVRLPRKDAESLEIGIRQPEREKRSSAILKYFDSFEILKYNPLTDETREVYDYILSFIQQYLGDQSPEILRSAADLIIELLKDSSLDEQGRKKQIEEVLSTELPQDRFSQLVNLGNRLTDYTVEQEEELNEEGVNESGVPVLFNEADEEEEAVEAMEEDEVAEDEDVVLETSISQEEEKKNIENPDTEVTFISADTKKVTEIPTVHPREIDAFWLQREIAKYFADAVVCQEKTNQAFEALSADYDLGELENELMSIFDYEHFYLVQLLTKNRWTIVSCTMLKRAATDEERLGVEEQIRAAGRSWILEALRPGAITIPDDGLNELNNNVVEKAEPAPVSEIPLSKTLTSHKIVPKHQVDLENYVFTEGSRLMSNKAVKLPEGSFRRTGKGYEEIHVPAPNKAVLGADERLVKIKELPEWSHQAFLNTQSLNRIQSHLYPIAFGTDENILLCAPTGAGKTNVAMLCILNELQKHLREDLSFNLQNFKIVYIAPLKALVQEMVNNFSKRLTPYNIRVAELTGDSQLTKQQISETQIIVTTPEKWDIITRKANDLSYVNLVRLVIIDEVHLLHDERGPVLESIVARIFRHQEETLEQVRLVGLSATLPNYTDVASFLHVDPKKGLFYFDSTYRPCPLKQEFIGITEKTPFKRMQTTNEACYEKVMQHAGKNQVLIFVHSRKETAKTARFIRDKALEEETIGHLLRSDAASREILRAEADSTSDENLKDLLPYGFAIHHAGMRREDRQTSEDLFADGTIQVLVSTATLAWGVNLPAHTVIIKGTQVYSPEKGIWTELSPQDVLQMLGRAGRPQFDTYGEGIIITAHSELQYYLSLMNQQLPIESQFMRRLADCLNAEVSLGTVRSIEDGVDWLGYTYLYVRMLRSPALYSVGPEYDDDKYLVQKRADLLHSAAILLEKCKLLVYNRQSGTLTATELGKVAASYYVTHNSMAIYNRLLMQTTSFIELFRVFSFSDEFKHIPVREEEKVELAKLLERVPIPIRERLDEPAAKINALLQSYISRQRLDGFALVADMVYVTQSAGRIMRAIFEISLRRGWSSVATLSLDTCKMIEKRLWPTMSPLRQFPNCPSEVIRRVEKKEFPWQRYFDLDPAELGELVGVPKEGRRVYNMVQSFPRLSVEAHVQPITRSLVRVELVINSQFNWDDHLSGTSEAFWILVEDVDGDRLLHYEQFFLLKKYKDDEHIVNFTVPLLEPLPPCYFIKIVSDRWLHSITKVPLSFQRLIMPEKFPAPTPLLDLQNAPVSSLNNPSFISLYPNFKFFNKIQTQVFNSVYKTNDSVFIGAPNGSGKTVCAELALLHHWSQEDYGTAVYIAPIQEIVDRRYEEWYGKFSDLGDGKVLVKLTGERSQDLKLIQVADLIFCTPSQWDSLSKRWRSMRSIQKVDFYICDELQLLGGFYGPLYEIVISRIRYMAVQLEKNIRVVGLSVSVANARDLGEWLGTSPQCIFNFSPKDRPNPLTIHLQSFSITHFPSLMLAMSKPIYRSLKNFISQRKSTIVFTPDRKVAKQLAFDLVTFSMADEDEYLFSLMENEAFNKVEDAALQQSLKHGIAYISEITSSNDQNIVQYLYRHGLIKVLIASRDVIYSLKAKSNAVIVMGTQYYDGKEHRYIDYPISELLQMLGFTASIGSSELSQVILMTVTTKKEYYKKFLNEPLPMESHLQVWLHDAFVSEISTQTIESKQDAVDWLTWSYMYRRLVANPAYYGLQDITHESVSEFLSDLVETTMNDLSEARLITVDDEDDSCVALNLAMIASHYGITYITMQTFALSLSERTKMKGLLEIVTSAAEYEQLPIRKYEDIVLERIHSRLPVRLSNPNYEDPHTKSFILLAAHFSRFELPPGLVIDQKFILTRVHNLLGACVDTLSSEGHLIACIRPMEMSQMVTQALWDRDSPLKQIPYFDDALIERCNKEGVHDVFDIIDLDDEKRTELLHMDNAHLAKCAEFINKYPDIDIDFEIEDSEDVHANSPSVLIVQLTRELEEDEEVDTTVIAPYFPAQKTEHWWLVISDDKTLLAIKKITLGRSLTTKMEFVPPAMGTLKYKLSCFSDSYMGVDYEKEFECNVLEPLDTEMEDGE